MTPSDMVIHGLLIAIPSFARWAIVLAIEIAMHVSHVDLDVTHSLDKFEADKALKIILSFVDLILEQKLHVVQVVGVMIICKE